MSNRRIIAVVVACALVLGAIVLVYVNIHGVRTSRLSTMQNLVEKNIKIGTSPEEVIRFLDSQKLEYSPLWRPNVMSIGRHDYGNLLVINAIKRRTKESLFGYEILSYFSYSTRNMNWRDSIFSPS
jgi:hypothetical protein